MGKWSMHRFDKYVLSEYTLGFKYFKMSHFGVSESQCLCVIDYLSLLFHLTLKSDNVRNRNHDSGIKKTKSLQLRVYRLI